jgi:hypothetical protein
VRRVAAIPAAVAISTLLALPVGAQAAAGTATGGLQFVDDETAEQIAEDAKPGTVISAGAKPMVAGSKPKLIDGTLYAPSSAPNSVKKAIWAGNKLQNKPYIYGGGHANFKVDRGYDCSGAVSFVLHHANKSWLKSPVDANGFATFGEKGKGRWITVYYKWGHHAYMEVAGVRLDTTGPGERGPRWRTAPRYDNGAGFVARHPAGL